MPYKHIVTGEIRQEMVKPYRAKYSGTCRKCSQPVNRGDVIVWDKTKKGAVNHQNCQDPRNSPWAYFEWEQDNPSTCSECGATANRHDYNCSHAPRPAHNEQAYAPPIPEAFEGDNQFDMQIPENDSSEDSPAKPIKTGDGLLDLISSQVQAKVIDDIKQQTRKAIDALDRSVKDKLDKLSIPTIELKRSELPTIKLHNVHKQFNPVLQLLNAGEYVYLHGSPGGHKSSIGPQLAEALGVRYGYMSLCEQTPEYVVKGFTSPIDGKYYPSQFVDFYENGGLFCWEEMDAANDNLRSSLNTMLENGVASLDKGLVKKHEKFYMLTNGNTCGRGAHPAFPSRTAFDAAFAARFFFLEFEYDWALCKHIATGLNKHAGPLVDWAEKVCNWALANGVQLVMSPREVYKLAKLSVTTELDDTVILDGMLKGLDIPSKEKMLANYPFPHIIRSR